MGAVKGGLDKLADKTPEVFGMDARVGHDPLDLFGSQTRKEEQEARTSWEDRQTKDSKLYANKEQVAFTKKQDSHNKNKAEWETEQSFMNQGDEDV